MISEEVDDLNDDELVRMLAAIDPSDYKQIVIRLRNLDGVMDAVSFLRFQSTCRGLDLGTAMRYVFAIKRFEVL